MSAPYTARDRIANGVAWTTAITLSILGILGEFVYLHDHPQVATWFVKNFGEIIPPIVGFVAPIALGSLVAVIVGNWISPGYESRKPEQIPYP